MFKVNIYKDVAAFEAKNSYNCGQNIRFIYEGFTDLNMPLLITYSYDPRVANVNYRSIRDQVISQQQTGVEKRRKRSSVSKRSTENLCQKRDLIVLASEVFYPIFSEDPECEIVWPLDYNAGICGGNCVGDDTLPGPITNHAPFISILISSSTFSSRHSNYVFKPCCAPVKYSPLRVYTNSPTKGTTIVTIDNMVIDKCDCIDILDQF